MDEVFERDGDGSLLLSVFVQPGASRAAVVGRHGDALKVRVTAAAARGKANRATIELLAAAFHVPRAHVEVIAGTTSRAKKVRFSYTDEAPFRTRLATLLGG